MKSSINDLATAASGGDEFIVNDERCFVEFGSFSSVKVAEFLNSLRNLKQI